MGGESNGKNKYPSKNARAIIPVYGTFAWVAHARDVRLTTEKDWVDKRLGFVDVAEQEYGSSDEAEKDGEVVSDEQVR